MRPSLRLFSILPYALIAGCAQTAPPAHSQQDSAPLHPPADLLAIPNATPQWEPKSRYGNPESYSVMGVRYDVMPSSQGYQATGIASWYGTKFHGKRASSGVPYDMYAMTAAHKTLPLPTYVSVKNLDNGKSIVVKVTDRGPFHTGRIIDLSYTAAFKLGITKSGTGHVTVTAITPNKSTLAQISPNPTSETTLNPPLYLQVGAFGSRDNAHLLRRTLIKNKDLGNITIFNPNPEQSLLYRVQVGPIKTQTEVDRLTQRLAQLGISQSQLIIPSSPIE